MGIAVASGLRTREPKFSIVVIVAGQDLLVLGGIAEGFCRSGNSAWYSLTCLQARRVRG